MHVADRILQAVHHLVCLVDLHHDHSLRTDPVVDGKSYCAGKLIRDRDRPEVGAHRYRFAGHETPFGGWWSCRGLKREPPPREAHSPTSVAPRPRYPSALIMVETIQADRQ